MKDLISIKRTAYVCFAILFAYCFLTIFYEQSEMISRYYGLYLLHKVVVLGLCVTGIVMAKINFRTPLLEDVLFWSLIIYSCAGELFYPGYNLAYIQLIILIPMVFNYTGRKTIFYIILSYLLFSVSVYFGTSSGVKADGYEGFYLDIVVSNFTATFLSLLLTVLVKKVKDQRLEEMRSYYTLGLQSSVFVHDAKTSLIHSYRELEGADQSKLVIQNTMSKLKGMLEKADTNQSSGVLEVFKSVKEEMNGLVNHVNYTISGEELVVKIPEYYLRSILLNLISNSIRQFLESTHSNPVIGLHLHKNGFDLVDNGPGFQVEVLKNVMREKSSPISDMGNGVGLINTKKLIESFNGTFHLENLSSGGKVIIRFL